ncbi:VCBS domain-containing protein [Pseudomonas sp. GV071]|nr:VCBS domain-containing protein [Pseudomonas sp. GV071]
MLIPFFAGKSLEDKIVVTSVDGTEHSIAITLSNNSEPPPDSSHQP